MNEFVAQFLIESREQVEQATADLLALEKAPDDKARLDNAFRAFHTLKGGAGIVDFNAMAHAVHAAEDVLSAARSGERRLTETLVGDCLHCLDQVVQWLDAMEGKGDLPPNADAEARAVVARFARTTGEAVLRPQGGLPAASDAWVESLLARHEALRGRSVTAIRYAPAADCFFEGVDPVARVAALPGLLAVEIEPASPWPPLDSLDPFACNVVLLALTGGSRARAVASLGDAADQCEFRDLGAAAAPSGGQPLSAPAREVLAAQIALLDERDAQGAAGRTASAGLVAANVLRHAGMQADAERVALAAAVSLAANDPAALRQAMDGLLSGTGEGAPSLPAPSQDQDVAARTLRVDAARIDALVNLTGELTVAKNAIGHAAALAQSDGHELAAMLKQRHAVLDRLVGELQRSVLGMRVLPLRHVLQRFPRLVREMSHDLGKPANLVTEGGDTEADKAIVEMLFEPLLHVLRNALDHGIENAAARVARGKPPVAAIRLRASRQGDQVMVEVSDDGQGIDLDRVRQVARQRKLVADHAAGLSDEEAIALIFEPGFSTAGEVTGLSGRGVGMDAVRTAVERMGGRVGIESRAGQGTTVRFTLPFSVMMTRVMVVRAGEQVFGIPLDAVVETLRIGLDRISPIGAGQAIVVRNQTMPLVTLAGSLDLAPQAQPGVEAVVVITRIDGHYGALRVDRIGERMEVMLKPLDGLLAGMPGIAGSTLLGDGSVLLVLDLGSLFE